MVSGFLTGQWPTPVENSSESMLYFPYLSSSPNTATAGTRRPHALAYAS